MFLKVTKVQKEWTKEMEADLIDAVRLRPRLWDPNCRHIGLKQRLYEEIAQELTVKYPNHQHIFTRKILNKKFKTLKSYYKREERKKNTVIPSYKPIWPHFEHLSFLSDPANFTDLSNNQTEDMGVGNFLSSETRQSEQSNQLVYSNSKKKASKRKVKHLQYEEAEPSLKNLTSVKIIEEKSFGLYLGTRIHNIRNRAKRNNLIVEVLNLINSYDDEEDDSDE